MRQKHTLQKLYLQTNGINVYYKYCRISNQIGLFMQQSIKNLEKNVCDDVKSNHKKFWKYVNNKRKTNVSIL